jgi:hypothetical protein
MSVGPAPQRDAANIGAVEYCGAAGTNIQGVRAEIRHIIVIADLDRISRIADGPNLKRRRFAPELLPHSA